MVGGTSRSDGTSRTRACRTRRCKDDARGVSDVAWLVLVISGMLETVWAVALARSEGLSRPLSVVIFLTALAASMAGLSYALREVPVGTGYAVWVGIGAAGTAIVGMAAFGESASLARLFCLLLVVTGIVGLKLFG